MIFLCFTQFGGSCLCLNLYKFHGTAPLSICLYQVTENRMFFVRFYICFSRLVLTILDNLDLSGRSPYRSSHQSPRAIDLQHQFSSNQDVQQQETRWLQSFWTRGSQVPRKRDSLRIPTWSRVDAVCQSKYHPRIIRIIKSEGRKIA